MALLDIILIVGGFLIGLFLLPAIIFGFGGMGLPSFGRIVFTIIQLTGIGTVLYQVDDGPTYELRALADPGNTGEARYIYVGDDVTGEPIHQPIDEAHFYRLGKNPFGLSFDPDADWLERYRIHRSGEATDGGDILTGEERGEMKLWSPYADTTGNVVVTLTRLSVFRGDYESLREVVRRTLPEAGDHTTISELFLILLSAGLMVVFFATTLVLF